MQDQIETEFNSKLEEIKIAKIKKDWHKVETLVVQLFRQIGTSKEETNSLLELVNQYLGSLIGNERFTISLDDNFKIRVNQGVERLKVFLRNRPEYDPRIDFSVIAAQNIALLSIDLSQHNKHKIASNLRKIGRPDISIELCMDTLKESKLNFYAQTILCASLCDLKNFDKAIEFAKDSIKYSPRESKHYSLVTLSRAYLMKGKSTGDIDDLEIAMNFAEQAIDLVLDNYTLNTFRAAAHALQDESGIEKSKQYESFLEDKPVESDDTINNIILEVIDSDIYFESVNKRIIHSNEQNLFNLVAEKSNQHASNFKAEEIKSYLQNKWYFVAELKAKCRICQKNSLAIFAHHVESEPHWDHEWAYSCWYCKYITDGRILTLDYISGLKRSYEGDSWGEMCPHCI